MKGHLHILMMLLLAWPGPLPVAHSHADMLDQPGGGRLLAQHLALYHPPSPPLSCESAAPCESEHPCDSSDGHCHWVPRWMTLVGSPVIETAASGVDTSASPALSQPRDSAAVVAWHLLLPDLETLRVRRGCDDLRAMPCWCGLEYHQLFCTWTC